jgi:peptide/nickel transport system substrate-binding protein
MGDDHTLGVTLLRLKSAAALAATAVAVLSLAACGGGEETGASGFDDCQTDPTGCNSGERADGGTITWAINGSWPEWNPTIVSGNNVYVTQALAGTWPHVGQFQPDGSFKVNDGIFASTPRLVNESPAQVEYPLNPAATWGDGVKISADDFIYHWYASSGDNAKCDGCVPAQTSWGSAVVDIEGSGDIVTVTYKDGYSSAEWLYQAVLSHPAHIAEREGFDWKHSAKAMAESQEWFSAEVPTDWTTGPYKITRGETGLYVILEPNPEWAGSAEVTLESIKLEVIENVDNIVTELRNGSIDGAAPETLTAESIAQIVADDSLDFTSAPGPGWDHIDLNTKNRFLSDVELRRAVLIAIDVENIIERTYATVQPDIERKRNHLFRNDSPYFQDFLIATGQGLGDAELSRKILDEAGYTWNEDNQLLTPEEEPVVLEFRHKQGSPTLDAVSQLAQANLADIGIEVTINTFPTKDLGPVLFGGEYDMIAFGWSNTPTFVNGGPQMWGSGSTSNFGGLDDPELDAILDRLTSTLDYDEAADIANEAVERVIADAYVLPIVETPVAVFASDRLVNVRDNWASQQRALYNIAEWGVRDAD